MQIAEIVYYLFPRLDVKKFHVTDDRKRALGSMISIQLACSIGNGENYGEALAIIRQLMNEWNISINDLLPKEKVGLTASF